MNALAPLIGVFLLAVVLTANYFRTAWRLGILRAFGRRHVLHWRPLTAGTLAALLPLVGALIALALIPSDNGSEPSASAGQLAFQLAASGLVMHLINDQLLLWGVRRRRR